MKFMILLLSIFILHVLADPRVDSGRVDNGEASKTIPANGKGATVFKQKTRGDLSVLFKGEPWAKSCGESSAEIIQECKVEAWKTKWRKIIAPWKACKNKLGMTYPPRNATTGKVEEEEWKKFWEVAREKCLSKCILQEMGVITEDHIDEKKVKELIQKSTGNNGAKILDQCMQREENKQDIDVSECKEHNKIHNCMSESYRNRNMKRRNDTFVWKNCLTKLNLTYPQKNSTTNRVNPEDMAQFSKEAKEKCNDKCIAEGFGYVTDGKIDESKIENAFKTSFGEESVDYYKQCMEKESNKSNASGGVKNDCDDFITSRKCRIFASKKDQFTKLKPCLKEKCKTKEHVE